MIECRPFNNSDPPRIAAFWQRHPLQGLARPVTPMVLERVILGKLYFHADDLLLAIDRDQLLGLLHFARLPVSDQEEGAVATLCLNMLLVDPACDSPSGVADELLHAGLVRCGGQVCTVHPCQQNLFYTGLYGGTCFPGFLESDSIVIQALQRCGFQVTHRRGIFRAVASQISFPMDRETRQLRRQTRSTTQPLLLAPDWRQASACSHLQRTLVQLESSPGGDLLGQVETWDPSPLVDGWSGPVTGIHCLQNHGAENHDVVSRALVAEAIAFIQRTPAAYVEIHDDLLSPAQLQDLGFELVDQALELVLEPG